MKQIRYIIADDHKIFREGLKMVLEDDEQIRLTGEVANGLELMALLAQKKPDIILLDIKMPGMDGFEATRNIRLQYPKVKILILTMYDEPHFILHMVQAGANGYLLKNAEAEEIKTAIRAVYESGNYFNDMVSKTMLKTICSSNRIYSSMRRKCACCS
jgi:DNA-binding NarL/FixJ family response regulator